MLRPPQIGKLSLSFKIVMVNLFFALLVFLILYNYSFYLKNNVKNSVKQANQDNLLYIAENIDKDFSKINQSVYSLLLDVDFASLNNPDFTSPNYIMNLRQFNQKLLDLTRLLPLDVSLYVYLNETGFVTGADGTRQLSLFYENLHYESPDFICNCLHKPIRTETFYNFDHFLIHAYPIHNVGTVIVKVKKSALGHSFSEYSKVSDNIILITAETGEFIASNAALPRQAQKSPPITDQTVPLNGNNYTPIHLYLNKLHYYAFYPEGILQKSIQTVNRYSLTLFIVFVFIVAGLLIGNIGIYRPVNSTIATLHTHNRKMTETLDQQQSVMEQHAFLRLALSPVQDIAADLLDKLRDQYEKSFILTVFLESEDEVKTKNALEIFETKLGEHYLYRKLMYRTEAHTYLISEKDVNVLRHFINTLLENMAGEDFFIRCGISSSIQDIRLIRQAIQESFYAIERSPYNWDTSQQITYHAELPAIKAPLLSITIEKEQELIAYVLNGNKEAIKQFFEETITAVVSKMSYGRVLSLFRYLQDILNVLITSKQIKDENIVSDIAQVHNPLILYADLIEKYLTVAGYSFTQNKSLYDNIVDYIHNNYKQDLSLTMIADQFAITSVYLSSYFKKHSGYNISYYIMLIRIREAIRQLQLNPHVTIKTVSEQVGYTSERTFTRNFKKITGTTPGQYLRSPFDLS